MRFRGWHKRVMAWLRPAVVLCLLALMVLGSVPAQAGYDLLATPVARSASPPDNAGNSGPDSPALAPECTLHVACQGVMLSVDPVMIEAVSSPIFERRAGQFLTGITAPPLPQPPDFF